ncbi:MULTISPECIES: minichromosome maintenance protein MCM [unclassified Thermococcus]|uniref:minichromosome maintenance protein MCM n=1 Tax=unclassified Thermococcus TaxID=2627626 RepID=UPI0005B26A10|nr:MULTISPECIES: minichromosome maintenance protein MCM [unclassified Thermococcus]HIH72362.1 minichromosome maintenance protein MCM [Thermococcaceae archaeon]
MNLDIQENRINRIARFLMEYSDENGNKIYRDNLIEAVTTSKKTSIEINWAHLSAFDPKLATELMDYPEELILATEDAILIILQKYFFMKNPPRIHARFYGLPETHSIREVEVEHKNKFIQVEGIIAKVREPGVFSPRTIFVCKDCGHEMIRLQKPYHRMIKPEKCECCGNRNLELDTDKSQFSEFQEIWIQDLSDKRRKIKAILLDDLVDTVSTKDHITATGILRLVPKEKRSTPVFEKLLEVNHIERQTQPEGQK